MQSGRLSVLSTYAYFIHLFADNCYNISIIFDILNVYKATFEKELYRYRDMQLKFTLK